MGDDKKVSIMTETESNINLAINDLKTLTTKPKYSTPSIQHCCLLCFIMKWFNNKSAIFSKIAYRVRKITKTIHKILLYIFILLLLCTLKQTPIT